MSSIDTFTMKDGRRVTVDFLDLKSIMKVCKKDWKEINKKLLEAIDFVNSPQYMINLRNSLCPGGSDVVWEANGSCLSIYRNN